MEEFHCLVHSLVVELNLFVEGCLGRLFRFFLLFRRGSIWFADDNAITMVGMSASTLRADARHAIEADDLGSVGDKLALPAFASWVLNLASKCFLLFFHC